MPRRAALAGCLLCAALAGCISPIRDFHGYIADEAAPTEMEPGVDTRTTVLARLGSPSTRSIFDENTWFYMSTQRERVAFFNPQVVERNITAIRFSEDDVVDDVLIYDVNDGTVISYISRETPTLGRRMSLLEQLLGSVGAVGLPQTDEVTPNNPTGRR